MIPHPDHVTAWLNAQAEKREADLVPLTLLKVEPLDTQEPAEVLEVSLASVKRDWDLARAWLLRELGRSKAA